ncbi:MAG: hypothetical protein ACMG6E_03800 [Candidatus Roizmanbacteria bacterium]
MSEVALIGSYERIEGTPPITITTGRARKPPFQVKPGIIWLVTGIIVILVIIIAVAIILSQEKTTVEIAYDPGFTNLNNLINLNPDGLCCIPPSSLTTTERYIYLPATDFTYSLDSISPSTACSGLSGNSYDNCINNSTDPTTQKPRKVAHRGIATYYTFSVGQANSTCSNFVPC